MITREDVQQLPESETYACPSCGHEHYSEWEIEDNVRFRWCDVSTCNEGGCCSCACYWPLQDDDSIQLNLTRVI